MSDEEPKPEGVESEFPLHSDFERLGIFLLRAQNLGVENSTYNPATLREYYSVLKEIWRMIKPIVGQTALASKLKKNIQELNEVTTTCQNKLYSNRAFKVPIEVFEALDELHDDLLQLKQDANLGIKTRDKLSETQKLKRAMLGD